MATVGFNDGASLTFLPHRRTIYITEPSILIRQCLSNLANPPLQFERCPLRSDPPLWLPPALTVSALSLKLPSPLRLMWTVKLFIERQWAADCAVKLH